MCTVLLVIFIHFVFTDDEQKEEKNTILTDGQFLIILKIALTSREKNTMEYKSKA